MVAKQPPCGSGSPLSAALFKSQHRPPIAPSAELTIMAAICPSVNVKVISLLQSSKSIGKRDTVTAFTIQGGDITCKGLDGFRFYQTCRKLRGDRILPVQGYAFVR